MEQLFTHFPSFLLVLTRVASFFVTLPLFSYRSIPNSHKIGIAFFISWIMFFTVEKQPLEIDGYYILLIFKEVSVGLLIGMFAYMILSAIQIAGGFIDFQMGFAIANVVDPQTGAQSPILGQYLYTFALLLMLAMDGHHLLIDGIVYSYQLIPLNQLSIPFANEQIIEFVLKAFGNMFLIAFQMSIPIVGSLFLVDLALGIVARTVPQFNIFVVGLPIKILVSFILLIVVMATLFIAVQQLFELMLVSMQTLMKLMGGS